MLASTWPPSSHQIGHFWWLLVCIFPLLLPSLLDMAPGRPPDLPKHPPDPNFILFYLFWCDCWCIFGHIVFKMRSTIFLATLQCNQCAKNLDLDFSQHVCRSCPITLPRYADLDSSSTIAKTRGPAVTREASSIIKQKMQHFWQPLQEKPRIIQHFGHPLVEKAL